LSGQKKKKNHWVPQSYLRMFAADEARERIWTLRHDGGDPELRRIEKVAVKFYLYAPKGPAGRDYTFENKLASLEQMFGCEAWKIVCSDFVDLGDETYRKMLALLTAVMWMRNPLHLDQVRHIHTQIRDFMAQSPELPEAMEIGGKVRELDHPDWPAYRDASDDDITRMWLDQVGSATWLAESFMKMRWSIMISERPVFVTSDNPVMFIHPSLDFRGFSNPETSIVFPLSPTRVLHLDNRHSEPDNQYYPLNGNGGTLNSLVWRNAIQSMFAPRPPDEVCAEICAEAEAAGFRWRPGGWTQARSNH
jgi:hypothetical protein